MKLLYIFFSFPIFLLPMVNWSEGQSYYNVSKFFVNMSFGQVHHGTFNITECNEDMMACWESIVPDTICHQWYTFSSICDVMREYCLDAGSETYTVQWWHRWFIRENECMYWWVDMYESRRAGAAGGAWRERARARLARRQRYRGSYTFHFVPEL